MGSLLADIGIIPNYLLLQMKLQGVSLFIVFTFLCVFLQPQFLELKLLGQKTGIFYI